MSGDATRTFVVESSESGWRLDAWLAASLGASRAAVRRELDQGRVRVDGRTVGLSAKGERVAVGTQVEVRSWMPPAKRAPIAEPEAALRVLAEGPGWVAVDKPAGQPVHPLADGEVGTVLNALVARRPEILGVGEAGLRSGVVHRLDVDTSGVLLFATSDERFRTLRAAFRRHRVAKTYRALVGGALEGEGSLVVHLAVARHRPARVRVVPDTHPDLGRTRRTALAWRALERLDGATLVEVRPETGFLHQIRVSLAHLGHPVLGDLAYGAADPEVPRQMLHASGVSVRDVAAQAPDPADFAGVLARLGGTPGRDAAGTAR